nr:uncharacterized protein LOC128697697 isoform X1 [Cherax quadricarinatus]
MCLVAPPHTLRHTMLTRLLICVLTVTLTEGDTARASGSQDSPGEGIPTSGTPVHVGEVSSDQQKTTTVSSVTTTLVLPDHLGDTPERSVTPSHSQQSHLDVQQVPIPFPSPGTEWNTPRPPVSLFNIPEERISIPAPRSPPHSVQLPLQLSAQRHQPHRGRLQQKLEHTREPASASPADVLQEALQERNSSASSTSASFVPAKDVIQQGTVVISGKVLMYLPTNIRSSISNTRPFLPNARPPFTDRRASVSRTRPPIYNIRPSPTNIRPYDNTRLSLSNTGTSRSNIIYPDRLPVTDASRIVYPSEKTSAGGVYLPIWISTIPPPASSISKPDSAITKPSLLQ